MKLKVIGLCVMFRFSNFARNVSNQLKCMISVD